MSTHYTTARTPRQFRHWGTFLLDVAAPLFLIATSFNALMDNHPHRLYYLAAADFYIMTRLSTRLSKKYNFAIFLTLTGIQFFALGVYMKIFEQGMESETLAAVTIIMGFICAVIARTEIHGVTLARLSSPMGEGARAADFPGIYRIICVPNGKQYIGQTSQAINARWGEHRAHLEGRRHHNRWMQADWDIYRPEQFKWEVLEVVTDPVWLLDRERAWQDKDYDAAKRYNPPNLAPRIVKASRRPAMKRKTRS